MIGTGNRLVVGFSMAFNGWFNCCWSKVVCFGLSNYCCVVAVLWDMVFIAFKFCRCETGTLIMASCDDVVGLLLEFMGRDWAIMGCEWVCENSGVAETFPYFCRKSVSGSLCISSSVKAVVVCSLVVVGVVLSPIDVSLSSPRSCFEPFPIGSASIFGVNQ